MKQHVITEWLLNDFAHASESGLRIATYSKSTDAFGSDRPADFMARIDSHSPAVEDRLQRIEGPAARAARSLVAAVLLEPPGIARLTAHDEPAAAGVSDGGTAEGFRLVVAHRGLAALKPSERAALGKFATLMFTRSPKMERTIELIADVYYESTRAALRRAGIGGPLLDASEAEVRAASDGAPTRAIDHVRRIGGFIAGLDWWVVRTGPSERFVLGDTPTCAAVALGEAEVFLPLLGPSTFVVTLPLHPEVALLATSTPVLPVGGSEANVVTSINRLTWLWAEEFVIATDVSTLEAIGDSLDPVRRRRVIPVPFDEVALRTAAAGNVASVLATSSASPLIDRCTNARRRNLTVFGDDRRSRR